MKISTAILIWQQTCIASQPTDTFVATDSGIRQLLQDNGYKQFSPFQMSVAQIQGLIAVLSNNGVYERTDSRKTGLSKKVKSFFFKHKTA